MGEIAYAVFDVAGGAERQVRMIEEACTAGPARGHRQRRAAEAQPAQERR